MEKTVMLVRHAQATHNKTMTDGLADGASRAEAFMLMDQPALLDARLTPLGTGQAKALGAFLRSEKAETLGAGDLELVASSPLSRTLATASLVFEGAPDFRALPSVRERCSTPRAISGDGHAFLSEKRRKVSELHEDFPRFDYGGMAEEDDMWTQSGESRKDAATRATAALRWLWECEASRLAIVTHGGFLEAALLNVETQPIELDEASLACPSGWGNVELRSYRVTRLGAEEDEFRLRFELLHRVGAGDTSRRAPSRGPSRPKLQAAAEVIAWRRELEASRASPKL
jgi:broad specificity phosphatase PhoE